MEAWLEEAKEGRADVQMPDHLVRGAGGILRHATDEIESSTDDSRCVACASHVPTRCVGLGSCWQAMDVS